MTSGLVGVHVVWAKAGQHALRDGRRTMRSARCATSDDGATDAVKTENVTR